MDTWILINAGPGYGILSDGTKPSAKSILTPYPWCALQNKFDENAYYILSSTRYFIFNTI